MPVLDGNFEAFVTNLGKYNEGALVGEWVKFPTTQEEMQKVFERIGIGSKDEFGQVYEELFITDYECPLHGVYDVLGEYESLDKLNYLAGRLEELDKWDQEKLVAIMDSGCDEVGDIDDLINLTYNLDCYDFIPDIHDASDLGYYYVHDAGIYDVRIERIRGDLTDHYSPNEKVLRLSDSVYGSTSVAAIGVAAHECGHAIQHQEGYAPLKLRSFSVPLANIGSRLSWPIIVLGLILGWSGLLEIGILLFVFVVAFQLITLPVEFDASHRAIRILEAKQLFGDQELQGAKKVLTAAALTYVAALASAILQLVRLILISRRNDD